MLLFFYYLLALEKTFRSSDHYNVGRSFDQYRITLYICGYSFILMLHSISLAWIISILLLLIALQKSRDSLKNLSRIGSFRLTLTFKLKLEGSSINWQRIESWLKMSSKLIGILVSRHKFWYSGISLFLMSVYALQIVKICNRSSFLEGSEEQHLQWGDPPHWLALIL